MRVDGSDRTDLASAAPPRRRGVTRAVLLPTEHGGWALTLEPAVLGLLVAASGAGWCLAAAALLAFLARVPVKVVLVDRWRRRSLDRTRTATVAAGLELVVLGGLIVAAAALAVEPFWWPLLLAGPLVGVELWFDMRSRSRRLIPELAGAVGVSAVAAMIALAGGSASRLALGLWLILAARVLTSVPFVRGRIAALHRRPVAAGGLVLADLAALVVAAGAVALARSLAAGAITVVVVVVLQRLSALRPPSRVGVVGVQQVAAGLAVVVITAVGVHLG